MANNSQRQLALDRIRENISRNGWHVYLISGGPDPRFAYTIGLRETLSLELVMAGSSFYLNDDMVFILNEIASKLKSKLPPELSMGEIGSYGSFTLRKVHTSWTTTLMLGALDFFQVNDIQALQIVPDKSHWTIDIPNLSEPWSPITAPAWKWLHEPWTYSVPTKSVAATNLDALRGERITEVMRWEESEWEIFAGAGPDIPKDEIRFVPLGTLIAADRTLVPVVDLAIGEGFLRDADSGSDWRPWRKRGQNPDAPPIQGA